MGRTQESDGQFPEEATRTDGHHLPARTNTDDFLHHLIPSDWRINR
ncbi:hypothetical protein MPS_5366 [Mycobacterium pseudoshottsii JCM 15466]|nr:hypothetical protein MPS_5366 [Mycobacterium pseudoshottsii JCM 15466]